MKKQTHEIRDPIHTFIRIDSAERKVVDSRPLQRLRHIHQLAMSHLLYPGATHKRFEHSLGVMELSGRVFDVITRDENILRDSVRQLIPTEDARRYWRRVLRMAALCHDVGHLPFSHAAEDLLPKDWNHERLTFEIIRDPLMMEFWNDVKPPLKWQDIVKLAVGPKKCMDFVKASTLPTKEFEFSDWETILAEVIVGDAFGVDRMDYLLRDSYHAGVAYGRFDHYRLVDTLRILPKEHEGSDEPALGVEEGGLYSAEAMLLARYFMYTQVYFHPVRKIYDVHLKDFLTAWLTKNAKNGKFPTQTEDHLLLTDNEVMAAILKAAFNKDSPGHDAARRMVLRDHFHLLYQRNPVDTKVNPEAAASVHAAALEKYGVEKVRRDKRPAKSEGLHFPVLTRDGRVASSMTMSQALQHVPPATFDFVFVDAQVLDAAKSWLKESRDTLIQPKESEETDGSVAT